MEASYAGAELELFAKAVRWKSYWREKIRPFVRGRVLEVGAGNGNNTLFLQNGAAKEWLCVEPDPDLCAELKRRIGATPGVRAQVGTLRELGAGATYDTILYLDVLEHIADDGDELRAAAKMLAEGGHLIVLAPAHEWLFTAFDRAIGHYRRYTKEMLGALDVPELTLVSARYVDSVGLLASLGNRLLLKQSYPTAQQLAVWDRFMIPASRVLDPLLGYRVGKSVVGIWRR